MLMWVHEPVYVCGGQRLTIGSRAGLILNLVLCDWLKWLTNEPQGIYLSLCSPTAILALRLQADVTMPSFGTRTLGTELRPSCIHKRHTLTCTPAP